MTEKVDVYVLDLEYVKGSFRRNLGVDPKVWKCPCDEPGCQSHVVYARGADGRFYFMCTMSVDPGPRPTIHIGNVEDFAALDEVLPTADVLVYRYYLAQGLKQAILSA